MFKIYFVILLIVIIFCFSNVKADEPKIEYWPNGNKKSESEMKDGIENGKRIFWFKSGAKNIE